MKTKFKNAKGITLIALVITIIVLLILAGVTIATLTGENGILTQASNAREKNKISQAEEEVELAFQVLKIQEQARNLNEDEKIEIVQNELKRSYPEQETKSTITKSGTIYPVEHKGYKFEVNEKYEVSQAKAFDSKEWDKKATSEDCFVWDGNTIIGYNAEPLSGVISIRIPSRCTAIRSDFNTAWEGYRLFVGGIARVEIPETVTEIGDYAFLGFDAMESITIPDSVITLGEGVFINCTNLANVTLSNNLKSIGSQAFGTWGIDHPKCESLKSIVIPDSVETIEDSAFEYCRNLESVTLPKNLKKIGGSAFYRCNLQKIVIPESVTTIGWGAFKYAASNPIYCRVSSKPQGWSSEWNVSRTNNDDEDFYYDVVWGYIGE